MQLGPAHGEGHAQTTRAFAPSDAGVFGGSDSVVAVSCSPATFARDARLLVDGGFQLERVLPVDQFLWSAHIEIVGNFKRLK